MIDYNLDNIEFKNNNGIDKASIVNKYKQSDNDKGSVVVQIALLVSRIRYLNDEHFNVHKGDKHSRQGLIQMVSNVKKLLKYLYRKNFALYSTITKELKIEKWLKLS